MTTRNKQSRLKDKGAGRGTEKERRNSGSNGRDEDVRALLDFSPIASFVLDTNGTILALNDTMATRHRVTPSDLLGRCVYDTHPKESARFLRSRHLEAIQTKKPVRFEFEREGKILESIVYPIADETGRVTRIVGHSYDVTERKRMEEELRKSRDELEQRVAERTAAVTRLAAVVEAATESIMIADPSWRIEYVNPAFTRYTGYRADEATGRDMSFLRSENQDAGVYEGKRQAAIEGTSQLQRLLIRRKDGTDMIVDSTTSRLKDASGQIRNIVIVHRDVTRQLQLEEQLHQAQKMEAIGTLAGGIAHDFNNMLAVIMGNAEMALEDLGDDNGVGRNIDQIFQASKRARELVKQILAFSRKDERQKKTLTLTPLLKETAKLLRGSLPSTINIKLAIAAESDTIIADPSRVQQVVMNLASNAAHAMREDGGTLAIRLSSKTFVEGQHIPDGDMHPGRYVQLSVRDTGARIPREIRSKIFDPFFTTKEPGQGTGMGLAVVFGIVKSYGGAITVESEAGKGSTFKILFPVSQGTAEEEPPKGHELPPAGKEAVLLVDDEPSVVAVASRVLQRLGYRVTTADSGPEALEKFAANPSAFDLVITDHIMPKMTGLRLAEKILRMRDDIPVILFTGYSETLSADKAKAAGICEVLMKPVVKKELAETVRQVLDSRGRGSAT